MASSFVHLADIAPRSPRLKSWEMVRQRRVHWLVECVAEFMGVFVFAFTGLGSAAAFVLGNISGNSLSSLFQVGMAYGVGLILAIVVCASTSGGHLNPAVTISLVITKKFPVWKAAGYIVAQILGGYVASLLVYVQYHKHIAQATGALEAAGTLSAVMFTPSGPAGIFATYLLPDSNIGQVFLNEFVCDFIFGVVVWAVLDPTNTMVSPIAMPWIFGVTLAALIWGYVPVGVVGNTARDIGGRLAALTIWGSAAGGGIYAVLASLTNIPGILLGALFYEFILSDSSRVITPGNLAVWTGNKAYKERLQEGRHGVPPSPDPSYAEELKFDQGGVTISEV